MFFQIASKDIVIKIYCTYTFIALDIKFIRPLRCQYTTRQIKLWILYVLFIGQLTIPQATSLLSSTPCPSPNLTPAPSLC